MTTTNSGASVAEQRRAKMALFYSNLRTKFVSSLKQHLEDESNGPVSLWLLSSALFSANGSHVSINNINDTDTPTYTNLRFRYLHVQSYSNVMNFNQLKLNYPTSDDDTATPTTYSKPLELIPNLIDTNQSNLVAVSKQHIHSWIAFDMGYKLAVPLIIFPKSDDGIESNLDDKPIKKTVSVGETPNGDLNSLVFVFDWLKLFAQQIALFAKKSEDSKPHKTILLANSYIYMKLCMLGQKDPELVDQINTFMTENRIYFLFYPTENASTAEIYTIPLLDNLFWKLVGEFSLRDNPSSQLAIVQILRQVLREIGAKRTAIRSWFLRFSQMAEIESYVTDKMPEVADIVPVQVVAREERELRREDSKANLNDVTSSSTQESSIPTIPTPTPSLPPIKLTEPEVLEYCEWVDDMSRIGSLCIKYTFLRDLYLKQISQSSTSSSSSKDLIASEKKWLDLIGPKNRMKFKYPGSMGLLSENDYLLKWLDVQSWRLNYHQFVRHNLATPVDRADQLWTFDIITFPYSVPQTLLRQPERDFEQRPRNLKPRVSVLFAFSASGDYLQPYFVYPQTFVDDESSESTSAEWSCVSPNGYVTFRVFETWFFDMFLPYLAQQHTNDSKVINDIVLLFCAKLAVIDKKLYQKLKKFNSSEEENKSRVRINLFSIGHESQMPFELLFKKNLRKRQTDLFLDSWRKVTTKLGLPFQFKCTSKQQFFNLFMDAFQNCIEDIGNENSSTQSTDLFVTPSVSGSMTSTNTEMSAPDSSIPMAIDSNVTASQSTAISSSVQHFRAKMASSFEQCKLWPLSDEDYAELLEEAKKKHQNQNNTHLAAVSNPTKSAGTTIPKPVITPTRSATVATVKMSEKIAKDTGSEAGNKSADERAVIKSLDDLLNQDLEMQKLVKDMIRNELGKIINHLKPIEPSIAKTLPMVTSALQVVNNASSKNDPTHTNLVRDLLEIIIETKRRENPFGLRTALNDLETLQRKFNMFNHNSARKSDLLRKVVTNLVPNSSRQLLNSLSRLLCEYYSSSPQQALKSLNV